jgi:hypothetical protein
MSSTVNVYQVNDIEWYAAVSPEQAIEMLVECVGPEEAKNQMENGTYPIELDDRKMQLMQFCDADNLFGDPGKTYTFAQALQMYLERGWSVPFPFAMDM